MGESNNQRLRLPNVRRQFIPDKGKVILDCDLKGADAQVVAWEANDHDLKTAFKAGLDIHNKNGADLWGASFRPDHRSPGHLHTMRDECKRSVHATNYGASPRTVAITLQWKMTEAEGFQRAWFNLHPGILAWQRRVEYDLQATRTIRNMFGYRIIYLNRPDGLLPEALAWIPQSTVALIASRGAVNLSKNIPWVQLLLPNNHDSVVFQIPFNRLNAASLKEVQRHLEVIVPYKPEPLNIPWSLQISEKSWGDVKKQEWPA